MDFVTGVQSLPSGFAGSFEVDPDFECEVGIDDLVFFAIPAPHPHLRVAFSFETDHFGPIQGTVGTIDAYGQVLESYCAIVGRRYLPTPAVQAH